MIYAVEAFRVLFANKLRSLLTMLGLIVGVGAVVAIAVLGSGMAGGVGGLLGGMSDESFILFPNQQQTDFAASEFRLSDLPAIREALPQVVDAVPIAQVTDLVSSGHQRGRYRLSPESAIPFTNLPLLYGRRIDQHDIDAAGHVAVLQHGAYLRLYPQGGDPTGSSIYAGPNRFVVIGVLTEPRRGFLNANFSGPIAIPWTTFVQRYVRGDRVFAARFVVRDAGDIASAETAVIKMMRVLRNRPDLQYQSFDKSQATQGINVVFGVITAIVAFIGAISLLVAGIGVMNIMLVSVAERTREIGVRKAIGARRSQILAQFFIEALTLCSAGCAIGWVLGIVAGWAVDNLAIVKVAGSIPALPIVPTLAIAVVFAIVVTLAFGTYPAFRAAGLDPIEALRYE
ncbi:MAG TPA: ABC transporter permease [Candidatus Tumulicola sp.]|jgi:putative ABC transport system permease protein